MTHPGTARDVGALDGRPTRSVAARSMAARGVAARGVAARSVAARGVAARLLAGFAATLAGLAGTVAVAAPAHAETVREGQWHLRELDIAAAHRITKGNGVLVAVVDTGVEAAHPDLKGQVRGGTGIGKGAGPAGGSVDVDSHGTAMAGVIAGRGGGVNNALGIAPGARILPVRITTKGAATGQDLATGIRWAADHGAKVINVSLADDREPLPFEVEAVAYALAKDAVVVAGAGNRTEGHDTVGVPARIPGVLAVGATTRSGRLWSGSVTGSQVAIAAPGEDIVSTGAREAGKESGYTITTGTSPATAVVSAAAALVRAKFPQLKAADVINRLITTAEDAGPDGRDEEFGFGRLDIKRALTADVPSVRANPLGVPDAASPTPGRGAVAAGDDASGTLTRDAVIGLVILGAAVLGLPLLLIILLVVAVRRRRRRRSAPVGPGGMAPPGYSPAGYPYPPPAPPGHPAASGYPPGPPQQPGQPAWPGQQAGPGQQSWPGQGQPAGPPQQAWPGQQPGHPAPYPGAPGQAGSSYPPATGG